MFGGDNERFLAHFISKAPDFDQLLAIAATGHLPSADDLQRGVTVEVPGRGTRPPDRLKVKDDRPGSRPCDGAHQFLDLSITVNAELYFEEGELSSSMTMDTTPGRKEGRISMSDSVITTAKIYPSIGIARVGNSPTGFFIGPEHVGETSAPEGGFKDAQGRMKRQAARFRVFGYDKDGRLVQEITKKDATITWTVHLANKKAAWKSFDGLDRSTPLRNAAVKDRARLVIDPGPRTIGPGQSAKFDTGMFMGQRVPSATCAPTRPAVWSCWEGSGSPLHRSAKCSRTTRTTTAGTTMSRTGR